MKNLLWFMIYDLWIIIQLSSDLAQHWTKNVTENVSKFVTHSMGLD